MVLVFADKVTSGTVGGESGFRPQSTESFPYRMLMMMMHQPHHDRPFPSPDTENGSEGGGAFFYSRSNEEGRSMSDIYGGIVGGGDGSVAGTMQPFNTTSFKSPGGMAASLRFPFTSVQWQELERQALIYKYIMASVPVPPDLLIPISRNVSETAVVQASCSNLRFSSGRDPEPGRCRRTDGKKWRCAKDVAPDQKYCERHMHKCRPRSRKLVELQAEMNTRSASTTPAITSNTSSSQLAATKPYHQHSGFLAKSDNKASPCESVVPSTYYKESRCVDWMMKGETVPLAASNQQWPQLMNSKVGLRTDRGNWNPNASVFQQHYEEPLNLNSYWTYGAGDGSEANQQNDERFLFLNPELASLEKPPSPNQRQMPRRFIHAWSTASRDSTTDTSNKSSILSKGKLSPSSLSLSMSSGSGGNENRDQIQMGLGVIDAERNRDGSVKTQPLSWMSPVSWLSSPPGGPLAEVLGPSPAAFPAGVSNAAFSHGCYGTAGKKSSCSGRGLNLMSDGWGGSGDAGSPSTTTVSSPADVLQKTLASLSDSSGSSSPTFAAGAEKSEIAVQWLNLNKFLSST